ncbi:hypothetical protein Q3G72_018994 [Acer saccharum]|nr:hypothetical protein Q3G72_018994 [Acer saccharum]
MIDLYRANQEPPSMTQTGSNVGCTRGDTTTVGGSGQVRSPNVMHGKCRLPSLRRASRMKKDMRKVKAKAKKAPEKGKRKERDEEDAPILNTQRSLFGHSKIDMANAGHVQAVPENTAFDISGTQIQRTVIQSQEITPVLNFGHPKKGRLGFLVVLEYLNVASTLQKQCGGPKVRFANDKEDIDDYDDILTYIVQVKHTITQKTQVKEQRRRRMGLRERTEDFMGIGLRRDGKDEDQIELRFVGIEKTSLGWRIER